MGIAQVEIIARAEMLEDIVAFDKAQATPAASVKDGLMPTGLLPTSWKSL